MPINPSPGIPDDRFDALVSSYLDGQLDPADLPELEQLLRASDAHIRRYRKLAENHAILVWESGAAPIAKETTATPSKAGSLPTSRRVAPIALALAAALLLATAVVVVYMAASADPQPKPETLKPTGPAVATLIELTGTVIVGEDLAYEGQDFPAGNYAIDSGTAEFQLTSGASVKMRGATRLAFRDAMNASLSRGSATFNCPPSAHGFTVHLPDGVRVVDLGTAFHLSVGHDNLITLVVTEGHVKMVTPAAADEPAHERIIHAGDQGRYRSDTGLVVFRPDASQPRPISVVNADFELPAVERWSSDLADGWAVGPQRTPPTEAMRDLDYGGVFATTAPSGRQVGFINIRPAPDGSAVGGQFHQRVGVVEPGVYHLDIAVRVRDAIGSNDTLAIGLFTTQPPGSDDPRRALALADVAQVLPKGDWRRVETTWLVTPDDPAVGEPLFVRIATSSTGDGFKQLQFDDLRLTHTPLKIDSPSQKAPSSP